MTQHSKHDLPLEEQLIVAFSRMDIDIDEISSLSAIPMDWHLVQQKANCHGVAPLIYHHLKKLLNDPTPTSPNPKIINLSRKHESTKARKRKISLENTNFITNRVINPTSAINSINSAIPSPVLEFFRQAYYENLARNLTLFHELRRILKSLDDRRIKVMVLKGAMLAQTVYKNPALRPLSDLDLLIRRQDVDEAEKVLLDSGYILMSVEFSRKWAERFGGERLYAKWADFPIYVDMHWYTTNYVWMGRNGMEAEAERIWDRARPTKILGVNTVSLSVEDLFLHILIHQAIQHFNFRLIWVRDIAELVKHYQGKINWQEVIKRARLLGIERPVHYSLTCAQELLQAQVPGEVLSEIKPIYTNKRETQFFDMHIGAGERRLDVIKLLYQYFKIPGIGEKIRFLSGFAFPGVAYMRNRYSTHRSKLVYLYYGYRPWYIFYRASVALFKLIGKRTFLRQD